jgi:hypothetical protein
MVTVSRSPGPRKPGPVFTFITKNDGDPALFTAVGNEADRVESV